MVAGSRDLAAYEALKKVFVGVRVARRMRVLDDIGGRCEKITTGESPREIGLDLTVSRSCDAGRWEGERVCECVLSESKVTLERRGRFLGGVSGWEV